MRGPRKVRRLLGRLSGWLLFLKLPILVYLVDKFCFKMNLSKYFCATWKMCQVFFPPLRCAVVMVALLEQVSVPEPEK